MSARNAGSITAAGNSLSCWIAVGGAVPSGGAVHGVQASVSLASAEPFAHGVWSLEAALSSTSAHNSSFDTDTMVLRSARFHRAGQFGRYAASDLSLRSLWSRTALF